MTTRLKMATNARYKDDAGVWQSKGTWHTVVVFGPSAEYAAKIEPGSLVFVEGSITNRMYEREIDTPKGPVKVQWPISEIIASSISVVSKTGTAREAAA